MATSPAVNFHGPALVGIFVASILQGMCLIQALTYYERFPNDHVWMKIYVGVLIFGDSLNSAFSMAWIYNVLVRNWGVVESLLELNWLLATESAMLGIIALMVQVFFAWRIKTLTGRWFIPLIVASCSLIACVGGLIFAVAFAQYPSTQSLATENSARAFACLWLIPPAIADITITISLSWHLRRARSGIKKTESIINSIIRTTVQNGLATTVVALLDVITFLAMPSSGIHIVFNYPLGKLYTNSVLSSLNARSRLRTMNGNVNEWDSSDHVVTLPQQPRMGATSQAPEVFVAVEMQKRTDHVNWTGSHNSRSDPEWNSSPEDKVESI